jgi:exonuclease III
LFKMTVDPHRVVLNWNVWGLNNPARCQVVRDLVVGNACTIVCLQETKLQEVNDLLIGSTLEQEFVDQYVVFPMDGTRGGVIIACSKDHYSLTQVETSQFSVTVLIKRNIDNVLWSLTGVYGPQIEADKFCFVQELRLIKLTVIGRWLLLGDFNLIYQSADKSGGPINRRLLNGFHTLLDELEVKEMHLHGHRFTWSSGTDNPTQIEINHVFATRDWELLYPDCHLQVGGSAVSNHCPMVLSCSPF